MVNRLIETSQPVEVQDTSFTTDVMGRYVESFSDFLGQETVIPRTIGSSTWIKAMRFKSMTGENTQT